MLQAHLLSKDFLSKVADSVHAGMSALDKEAASTLAFALVHNLIKAASQVSDMSIQGGNLSNRRNNGHQAIRSDLSIQRITGKSPK